MLTPREIAELLEPYEVVLSGVQIEQARIFTNLLMKWNRKINLTRIVDERGIYQQHFGESFYLARFLPPRCERILDVGSGCGFPGLALKLIRPHTAMTLLEASAKKALFLKEVIVTLGLEGGCKIQNERMENLCRDHKGGFDAVTIRGVHLSASVLRNIATQLIPGGSVVISTSKTVSIQMRKLRVEFDWEEEDLLPGSFARVVLWGRRCSA